MSDKKKKDIPAQEPEQETAAPVTEETEDKEVPAEEAAPETFTVTKEQMEKMEGLAKLVADVNDKYLRLAAEYDNYRKRTAKEKENAYGDAKADTVKPFLAECARKDIFLVTMADALYPDRLRNIHQPPLLLYGKESWAGDPAADGRAAHFRHCAGGSYCAAGYHFYIRPADRAVSRHYASCRRGFDDLSRCRCRNRE